MAQAPVPSYTAFLAGCPKPEAFAGIDQSAVEVVLARKTDVVASAFGDRATLPIREWDGACEDAVCALAAADLMAHRGYNRQAGADSEIARTAADAQTWCDLVAKKERHPYFVDSDPVAEDGPLGSRAQNADDWTRTRRSRCCGCR